MKENFHWFVILSILFASTLFSPLSVNEIWCSFVSTKCREKARFWRKFFEFILWERSWIVFTTMLHNKMERLYSPQKSTHWERERKKNKNLPKENRNFNKIACNSISFSLVINFAQVALRIFQGVSTLSWANVSYS